MLYGDSRDWNLTLASRLHRTGKPSTVLLAGCAKAFGKLTAVRKAYLERLCDQFERCTILVYQDILHSIPAFRERMYGHGTDSFRHWANSNRRVRLLMAPTTSELRTVRLAECRNALLAEAAARLPRDGVLAMVDLDPTSFGESLAPLREAVRRVSDTLSPWGALTANSNGPYYDRWALRSEHVGLDYDCWTEHARVASDGSCTAYDIRIDARGPIFEVDSAFGGLGLYGMHALRKHKALGCRFVGELPCVCSGAARQLSATSARRSYPAGRGDQARTRRATVNAAAMVKAAGEGCSREVCEHVPFNSCLRRHGVRIGIMPSLLVVYAYFDGHVEPHRLVHRDRSGNITLKRLSPSSGQGGEDISLPQVDGSGRKSSTKKSSSPTCMRRPKEEKQAKVAGPSARGSLTWLHDWGVPLQDAKGPRSRSV